MNSLSTVHEQSAGVLEDSAAAPFLRRYWLRISIISVLLLIPCFWHRHIEAGDLPSHVYNAWLAQLVETGHAPGLWLDKRWNNVFFDFALLGIGKLLGWEAAEKIATSGTVLIFFWGTFAFICSITRRTPWSLLPCLAMIAYGWMFEMGFMNCYASFGFAFWGLAILIGGRGRLRWAAGLVVPLIWLAHPVGLALFASIGAYILIAERLPSRGQVGLFLAASLFIVGIRLFIQAHTHSIHVLWRHEPNHLLDGFDQFLLYQAHYLLTARLFRALLWTCILMEIVRGRFAEWSPSSFVPLQLWSLTLLCAQLLPADIYFSFPQHMGLPGIGFLTERATFVTIILVCCLLGTLKPQNWHFVGFAFIAVIYFIFLYNDTGEINQMENRVDALVQSIPPGQRVIAAILTFPDASNVSTTRIIDRACVGRCFSYGSYEASAKQFRISARPGNPIVLADSAFVWEAVTGRYIVQKQDIPLTEIYQEPSDFKKLIVHKLVVGDRTTSSVGRSTSTFIQFYGWGALLFDLCLPPILISSAYGIRRRFGASKRNSL